MKQLPSASEVIWVKRDKECVTICLFTIFSRSAAVGGCWGVTQDAQTFISHLTHTPSQYQPLHFPASSSPHTPTPSQLSSSFPSPSSSTSSSAVPQLSLHLVMCVCHRLAPLLLNTHTHTRVFRIIPTCQSHVDGEKLESEDCLSCGVWCTDNCQPG